MRVNKPATCNTINESHGQMLTKRNQTLESTVWLHLYKVQKLAKPTITDWGQDIGYLLWEKRIFWEESRKASVLPVIFGIFAWMSFIICVHILKINTQFLYFCYILIKHLFLKHQIIRGVRGTVIYSKTYGCVGLRDRFRLGLHWERKKARKLSTRSNYFQRHYTTSLRIYTNLLLLCVTFYSFHSIF